MIRDIQDEILRIKKENSICILAHSYQAAEILEIADFKGDSYQLSIAAKKTEANIVIMCGVHFMAETVKLLSPQKRVILANENAGCTMADQADEEMVKLLKLKYPNHKFVCYINTTAALKTVCDVCVTSSCAERVVRKMEGEKIVFLPDKNLGEFVKGVVPEKEIVLYNGCCPIHDAVTIYDTKKAKENHPNALVLVHPECRKEVMELADYVGSTSGIMEYARQSKGAEFIIGTEISIAESLQYEMPDKKFHILSDKLICPNMKITTLMDVYGAVKGESGLEITLDEDIIKKARYCIDEMIRIGG